MGLVGDIIGGVVGLFSGGAQAIAADKANETNIMLTRENRDWQEKMSNTAYQRGTRDMKKAGINPMVAFMQGGASTPSSSAAQVAAGEEGEMLNRAAESAMAVARLENDLKVQDSQVKKNEADSLAAEASRRLSLQSAKESAARTKKTKMDEHAIAASIPGQHISNETALERLQQIKSQSGSVAAQAEAAKVTAEYDKTLAPWDAIVNRAGEALGQFSSAAGRFFRPSPNKTSHRKKDESPAEMRSRFKKEWNDMKERNAFK